MSENMKPSGIDWIGYIPESWGIGRIQHNYEVILGKMVTPEQESTDQTLENYLCAANIRWNGVDTGINKQMWYSSKEKGQYLLKKGDVLIMEGGSIGTTSVYNGEFEPCYIQNSVHCCRGIKSNNTKLLYYWMYLTYNSGYLDVVCNKATIAHYTKEKVCKTPLVLISPEEQDLIVDFLDGQCEKIDSIVTDLEKQIEILQKYKKSLITETVTKGLDKSAHVKESGIDAIGLINQSYVISKLKYIVVTPITDGPHETPILLDEGIPFLSAEAVRNERLEFDNKRGCISEADHEMYCKKCKPQRNDIFMIKSGATTGNIALVDTDEEFSVWSPLALIRCDNILIKQKFVFYSMLSDYFSKNVELSWSYGTQQNIGMGVIGNLQIVLPSSDEQTQMVNYLDIKCKKIDSIIERKKEQLTKITQNKKSLIYEYVTGKKRVKGAHTNGN
jgi:type I restriction enzyme S subunit